MKSESQGAYNLQHGSELRVSFCRKRLVQAVVKHVPVASGMDAPAVPGGAVGGISSSLLPAKPVSTNSGACGP